MEKKEEQEINKKEHLKKIILFSILGVVLVSFIFLLVYEANNDNENDNNTDNDVVDSTSTPTKNNQSSYDNTKTEVSSTSVFNITDEFSNRDLEQTADLTNATNITLSSDNDINIDSDGIYVLSGNVTNTTITVDAADDSKIQIVLNGVTITNTDAPAIFIKNSDKVFVTTVKGTTNTMSVKNEFRENEDDNLDAVIYSKSDITFNGQGILNITSTYGNGLTGKDDLKITGGTYNIKTLKDAIEANDSIKIYDGVINIETDKDGLHSENEDDLSLGYIYIVGGTLNINAKGDGIQSTSIFQIDDGVINIETSVEGIEGTYILINGGTIDIYSTDDGINASNKSNYMVAIVVNGGDITVDMAAGDTDGFDANGTITINGGNISVNCNSAFDSDGAAVINGGVVYANGTQITTITQQQMGGGKHGGNPNDMNINGGQQQVQPQNKRYMQ